MKEWFDLHKDLATVKEWFDLHKALNEHEPNLKSISGGLIPDSKVNCDDTELVGETIQSKLDNMVIEDVSIKRKDKVRLFKPLLTTTKIWKNNVHINSLILFTRLTALMNSEDDIAANVCYEFTPELTALIKDGTMKKAPKSVLQNHLFIIEKLITSKDHDVCVTDGGTLLHKFYWPKSAYGEVLDQCKKYVKISKDEKNKSINVVFDGYSDKNST